jgi:hypothetical protein
MTIFFLPSSKTGSDGGDWSGGGGERERERELGGSERHYSVVGGEV